VAVRPKKKCCASSPRCSRCPIRLLAEGKLSAGDAKKLFAHGRNRKELKKAKRADRGD
jgi:hypothetical protein